MKYINVLVILCIFILLLSSRIRMYLLILPIITGMLKRMASIHFQSWYVFLCFYLMKSIWLIHCLQIYIATLIMTVHLMKYRKTHIWQSFNILRHIQDIMILIKWERHLISFHLFQNHQSIFLPMVFHLTLSVRLLWCYTTDRLGRLMMKWIH